MLVLINGKQGHSAVVLTVSGVAKILRIGRITAYQPIARGEIPSIRIGKRILIPRHLLEEFLNHTAQMPLPTA